MWKKEDEAANVTTERTVGSLGLKKTIRTTSTIAAKAILQGEVKGEEDLLVLGNFEGTAVLEKNIITIGRGGDFKGTLLARVIFVEGMVNGDLKAREKIIFKETAQVKGNVSTARLVMEDGCQFQGSVDMTAIRPKNPTKPVVK